jgi:hypothetical protein
MKVAINIKTEDWNNIITNLLNENWKVKSKYDGFDAGIDFDFLIMTKDFKYILFGWDNFAEGEIKCSQKLFEYLSKKNQIDFVFGEPENLKLRIILLTIFENLFFKIGKIVSYIK